MQPLLHSWSQEKFSCLASQLVGYWAEDVWAFNQYPLEINPQKLSPKAKNKLPKAIRFCCTSPALKIELKYACWKKLEREEWAAKTLWTRRATISYIVDWLNTVAPQSASLLEVSLIHRELSFRSYLVAHGHLKEGLTPPRLNRNQEPCQYKLHNAHITTFRQIYKTLQDAYDDRLEYEREIWDLRKLGYDIDPTKSNYRINFSRITQPWLLQAVKTFIRYSLSTCSVGECQGRVAALSDFSTFLTYQYPTLEPSAIERPILLEYLSELASTGIAPGTQCRHISCLRTFLELCVREGWLPVPDKRLIYSEDFPDLNKPLPRFIPEIVIAQLNQHVKLLPPQVMRMVLLLQEAGMRISELCRLSFNCLDQDTKGDYFLRYYQFKMKKDHIIPITPETASVIQEQQHITREDWGEVPYLFLSPKGKPMKQQILTKALNRLAYEKQICDSSGVLWHFQSHQFRHTVGTSMINNGVPHHMVQRFLGHESPEMTSRYAYIFDQTLKEAFFNFKGKIVDTTGKAVQPVEIVGEIRPGNRPEWS
jgi:integrase